MHVTNTFRTICICFICINAILNAKNRVDVEVHAQSNKRKDNMS